MEYNVKITVRNNLILSAIRKTGARSVKGFCRDNGLKESVIGGLIRFSIRPITSLGEFSRPAIELMEVLGGLPQRTVDKRAAESMPGEKLNREGGVAANAPVCFWRRGMP